MSLNKEERRGFWSRLIQFNVDILDLSGLGLRMLRDSCLQIKFVGRFDLSMARSC